MRKYWLLGLFIFTTSLLYADKSGQSYIGYGFGDAEYSKASFNDDDDIEMFAIGYEYSDKYSLEFGYIDLGNAVDRYFPSNVITLTPDVLELETRGITLAPAWEWDLSRSWSISARAGISIFDIEKEWRGGTVVDDFYLDDNGGTKTEFFYGFRLQYDISDDVTLEVNWDNYEVESVDVDTVYAKINVYF